MESTGWESEICIIIRAQISQRSDDQREQDEEDDVYSKGTSLIPEGFIHTASELQAVFSTSNPVRVPTAT